MEIEHALFSANILKMSETCQKLAFTHPIVVLKSGLKNNWMKKLDHVNRPLLSNSVESDKISSLDSILLEIIL